MSQFAYARAKTFKDAHGLLTSPRFSLPMLKAGGLDVLDHIKAGLTAPDLLIDVRGAGMEEAGIREAPRGGTPGLRIPASATLSDVAKSELVKRRAPVLAQAAESAATPQVRNVASVAGNLLQRPRCWYYRNEEFACLKKGGHTCFAVDGENQYHAIFGDGPCHIVHPSNLAPALMALDGEVELTGGDRPRLALAELFHMPEHGIRSEHNLRPGEIITAITCSLQESSGFYAIKEKQSFDWPLVFAAVSLTMRDAVVGEARVYAGAVAPVPWRLQEVEKALAGINPRDEEALRRACAGGAIGARPMSGNGYKATLLPVTVRRAVMLAAGIPVEDGGA